MRRSGLALLAALLLSALPGLARAYTYSDTLTTIWKPLPNLPALVRPGDTLTVWANASPGVTGWQASLRFASLSVPLGAAGGGYQASLGRWVLGFTVPSGIPEELYDLVLRSDSTAVDTTHHSVKVLPLFRDSFYFAQITDTHLPEHAFSANGSINTADTTGMGDFDAVIADMNLIHPEFIIHTGDLVNEGELEEYLGMFEMSRALTMINRLQDPMFVVTGNHDIGGWKPTLPPDGTSRKDWWRHFGWPYLASPPVGDPSHSQNYSFDYGLLHCIGLEAYINNGSYDSYLPAIYGAQSFTAEQMSWLSQNIAAVPAGHAKLLYYHYDFGGTNGTGGPNANFTQINPAVLGINGAIWGHNHGVAEGNRTAQPFNLGLQSVIGGRAFRVFRVTGATISPGPMHHSGTSADSLAVAWSVANDGTPVRLTGTVTNRFGEGWEHSRLIFHMVDHDSAYGATGGTVAQAIRENGQVHVYVDCTIPASGTIVVTVGPTGPNVVAVPVPATGMALQLAISSASPWRIGSRPFAARFQAEAGVRTRVDVVDLEGRRVATLFEGPALGGWNSVSWDGRSAGGSSPNSGLYFMRLESRGQVRAARIVMLR